MFKKFISFIKKLFTKSVDRLDNMNGSFAAPPIYFVDKMNIDHETAKVEIVLVPKPSDDEIDNEGDRDNEDETDNQRQPIDFKSDKGEKLLYYPDAIEYENDMRTRGRYSHGYPRGAVVHFTAGRSRRLKEGGSRAKETHLQMGAKSVYSALKKNSYCYFIIDRDGNVHQPFPLDRWGYHAGKSNWGGIGTGVSDELVGIEVQCAGRLDPSETSVYTSYFTSTSRGDKVFQEDEVRHAPKQNDNIQKGYYHKYSEAQEKALYELCLWLKFNNPDVFKFDYVLGHDEVSGKKGIGFNRKNDPGASLSMTMTEFRMSLLTGYTKHAK